MAIWAMTIGPYVCVCTFLNKGLSYMRFVMLWECWNSVTLQSGRQSQSDSDTLFIFFKNHWVSLELKNKVSYIGMASNDKEDILEPACLCMALWMIRQIPLLMTFLIKYFLYLGTPSPSKTDEFSEKFQTAIDPPPHFSESCIANFFWNSWPKYRL